MQKNIVKIIEKTLRNSENYYIFLWSFLFGVLALLYFSTNSLQVYDGPGHLNLIWNLKNYLWPSFSGWNSFTLLGFDQGVSYPALFHYLASTLSFIFGIETSTLLLLSLALLTLPLSVYYFVASLTSKRNERLIVTATMLLTFLVLPGHFGASLKSLTQIGLLTSFFSLPLVFFYLGSLPKIEAGKIFWPSVLLTSVILTHLVAGLFAGVIILSLLTVKVFTKTSIANLLLHLGFALIFTSFFWLPFLFNYSSLSVSAHVSSLGWPNLVVLILASSLTILLLKKKNYPLTALTLTLVILSILTTTDNLFGSPSSGFQERIYNLHLYRFQSYAYLLLVGIISLLAATYLTRKGKEKLLGFGFWVILLGAVLLLVLRSPFIGTSKIEIANPPSGGRFLETFSRSEVFPVVYTVQEKLISEKGLPWAYGLFTDGSANGPYLGSLIKSFRDREISQEGGDLIEEQVISEERLKSSLQLFGISNLLETSSNGSLKSLVRLDNNEKKQSFFLNPQSATSLVEVSPWRVRSVRQEWEKEVKDWWLEEGGLEEILVNDPVGKFSVVTQNENAKAEVGTRNANWSNFDVEITSKEPVPVLIKLGYSPNWKAYSERGEVEIYQASPSLMLVLENGKVTFVYEKPWQQRLLLLLSLGGFGFLWFQHQSKKRF